MNEELIILNKLIDKYESSKSFIENTERTRGVILKCDKRNFPEYDYEDFDIKKRFYQAASSLEQRKIIKVKYRKSADYLIEEIRLIVENISLAYKITERYPLKEKVEFLKSKFIEAYNNCTIDWLREFYNVELVRLNEKTKLNGIWKKEISYLNELFIALDNLSSTIIKPISMRVFSIKCYRNSKYFEKVVVKDIISIIKNYEPVIHEMLDAETKISDREILSQVGILSRAEIFEFCGNINVITKSGECNFSNFKKGACIRSESISEIENIVYKNIKRVLLIENKTNYDEYILNAKKENELVIYHGGFYSPQKAEFFKTIVRTLPSDTQCLFWADIDYGGFKMFCRLQGIFPKIVPFLMDETSYEKYVNFGLEHEEKYFQKLSDLLAIKDFDLFHSVIRKILKFKKTVEQEIMLD